MIDNDYVDIAIYSGTVAVWASFIFMLLGMGYLSGFVFAYKIEDHPKTNITSTKLTVMKVALATFWFLVGFSIIKISLPILKDIKKNGNPFLQDISTPQTKVRKTNPDIRADTGLMI